MTEIPDQRAFWEDWHTTHDPRGSWVETDEPLVNDFIGRLPAGSEPVIDLGCGQCTSALYAAGNAGQANEIVALDFSERALDQARSHLRGRDPQPLFVQADLREPLPFADSTVRGAYSHLSLHYFDGEDPRP